MSGGNNLEEWQKLGFRDKCMYELGQRTMANARFTPELGSMTAVQRGQHLLSQGVSALTNTPSDLGGFINTWPTGPTPALFVVGNVVADGVSGAAAGLLLNYTPITGYEH